MQSFLLCAETRPPGALETCAAALPPAAGALLARAAAFSSTPACCWFVTAAAFVQVPTASFVPSRFNEAPNMAYTSPNRRSVEALLRKLLRMPHHPAVIVLHHYGWFHRCAALCFVALCAACCALQCFAAPLWLVPQVRCAVLLYMLCVLCCVACCAGLRVLVGWAGLLCVTLCSRPHSGSQPFFSFHHCAAALCLCFLPYACALLPCPLASAVREMASAWACTIAMQRHTCPQWRRCEPSTCTCKCRG